MFEPFQSWFIKLHIAKTIMVKVTNDLLMASDPGGISIFILLDLSSAFVTAEHTLLLSHLENLWCFWDLLGLDTDLKFGLSELVYRRVLSLALYFFV